MKYKLLILIVISNLTIFSQLKICDTISIKKTLLYEYSKNSVSLDDMILRERSFIEFKNNKPRYNLGIYYIDIESKRNRLNLCENLQILNKLNSDSVYKVLDTLNFSEINYKGVKYKKYNLEMCVVYLGNEDLNYIEKYKIKTHKAPMYKIISIKSIRLCSN